MLFATPRPIDDYAAVDIALGRARQVGVDTGFGKRVNNKLNEPSALMLDDVITANAATAAQVEGELDLYIGRYNGLQSVAT